MNSLKTVVVVTVLLGVMYAVYSAINNGNGTLPQNAGEWPAALNSGKTASGPLNSTASSGDSPLNVQVSIPGESVLPASPRAPGQPAPAGSSIPFANLASSGNSVPAGNSTSPLAGSKSDWPNETAANPFRAGKATAPPDAAISPVSQQKESDSGGKFSLILEAERAKLDAGHLDRVLRELSPWFGSPELTREESRQLTDLLDQLAGTVIYSRQHLLEPAYVVKPGETLESVAEKHGVTTELLAKINGIRIAPPAADRFGRSTDGGGTQLRAGRELKMLHGPFEAVISLARCEFLVKVGGCYAGRFPIGECRDAKQLLGTFRVQEKSPAPQSRGGRDDHGTPGESPRHLSIVLDGGTWIQGIDDRRDPRRTGVADYICLGPRDLEDVYDILSVGSQVTVQR
jgi:hypothetical protein